jgi:hypothetical protein
MALDLWISGAASGAVDKALELCETVRESQRAFALLLSLKSSEDIADVVLPASTWLFERFMRAEGPEKVELGWTIGGLFCGLHDARDGSYDPFEVDGFVGVREFNDACRNVKTLRDVASILDSGQVPSENLVFNGKKVAFEGFRHVLQVRFLRSCLGVAFQTQMAFNSRLHELLEYTGTDQRANKIKLSSVEKRLGKSPNSIDSKNASKEKKQNRERKQMQTSFDQMDQGFE